MDTGHYDVRGFLSLFAASGERAVACPGARPPAAIERGPPRTDLSARCVAARMSKPQLD